MRLEWDIPVGLMAVMVTLYCLPGRRPSFNVTIREILLSFSATAPYEALKAVKSWPLQQNSVHAYLLQTQDRRKESAK